MKILVVIIVAILLIAIVLALLIGIFVLFMYAIASGISYKYDAESSAWEYWEQKKVKSWGELTDEEKRKITTAAMIISDDVGAVVTEEQIIQMLKHQLPILTPNVGLSYLISS